MMNTEVELTEADLSVRSFGVFEEDWKGKLQDKDTTYHFEIRFSEDNKAVTVEYTSNSPTKEVAVQLQFTTRRATKDGIKISIFLHNGEGFYNTKDLKNGKETNKKFSNLEFIFFIIGPRCVFGIDMPAVLLHDLRLQRRNLANKYAIEHQLE